MLKVLSIVIISTLLVSCIEDGDEIYFERWISSIDVNGNNFKEIVIDEYDSFHPIPNRQQILLNDQSEGLSIINEDGSNQELIVSGQIINYPVISYNGEKVVFSMQNQEKSDIYIFDFGSLELINITETNDLSELYPAISTDGIKVCYTLINPDTTNSLMIYDRVTQEIDQVLTLQTNAPNTTNIRNNIFRGDSYDVINYIFNDSMRGLYKYDIQSNHQNVLFEGNIPPYPLSCSADGETFVFESDLVIYKYFNFNDEFVEISEGYNPNISIDGQHIVFVNHDSINLLFNNNTLILREGFYPKFSGNSEKIVL